MEIKFSDALNDFEPKNVGDLLIGYDEYGTLYSHDLTSSRHLLIAGSTGSGKNVILRQMVLSGMFNSNPKELQFAFYDPKGVEFQEFKNTPFNMCERILNKSEELESILKELSKKIQYRFKKLVEVKAKDFKEYNKYAKENNLEVLPLNVVVIDEISDVMFCNPEIEDSLVKVLSKGASAGVYIIIGTSSARANVIRGTLKANIESRIALKLSTSIESRVAIHEVGAEDLNYHGDMLYRDKNSRLHRLQGAYVSDEEEVSLRNYVMDKYSGIK